MQGTIVETAPGKRRLFRVLAGRDAAGGVQRKNKTFGPPFGSKRLDRLTPPPQLDPSRAVSCVFQ